MRLLTACAALSMFAAPAWADAADAAPEPKPAETAASSHPSIAAAPLVAEAAPYAIFHEGVRGLPSAGFASSSDLDATFDTLGAYDPADLASAWLAYSALIAAQDPEFVDSVRDVADYFGREDTLKGLQNDPGWMTSFKGTEAARVTIAAATKKDVDRLMSAGEFMDRETGRLRAEVWGKQRIKDNSARLALLRSTGVTRTASADMLAGLGAPIGLGKRPGDDARRDAASAFWGVLGHEPQGPTADGGLKLASGSNYAVNQALALAAYQALDAADQKKQSELTRLLSQTESSECLALQRMQLLSCVADVASHADETNCLAKHSLRGVGACFTQVTTR